MDETPILIEWDDEVMSYRASSVAVPGVEAYGNTRAEALESFESAMLEHELQPKRSLSPLDQMFADEPKRLESIVLEEWRNYEPWWNVISRKGAFPTPMKTVHFDSKP